MNKKRVRFAPSPSGFLHVGSARTALFNFLLAKKKKGVFVLRIEDTDKERSEEKYLKDILKGLRWLKLDWDEGIERGGDYGPYRQSERKDIYRKYIEKLIEEEKAYICNCSKEELEKEKEKQIKRGEAPHYLGKCRDKGIKPKGEEFILRIKTKKEIISFKDEIRGNLELNSSTLGDFVIAKGYHHPLYNLACVIDDYEMKITDIIRGEDHISNTPKQIIIQKALGFATPSYAHLPLILGQDRSKLSKRHGAVSVSQYKEEGILPEALDNFLALLGWSPGDDREIFSLEELIKEFSIERCRKSGSIFNYEKLKYINTTHIKEKENIDKLTDPCIDFLLKEGLIEAGFREDQEPANIGRIIPQTTYFTKEGREVNFSKIREIVQLHRDRLRTLREIVFEADFFFKDKIEVNFDLLKWKEMEKEEVLQSIDRAIEILYNLKTWKREAIEKALLEEADKIGDRGRLLWPLRAALSGKKNSAGPFDIAYILGREESLKRLKEAKKAL